MSPRQYLIESFKFLSGVDYSCMFMNKLPQYLLEKKLLLFVKSLVKYLAERNYNCDDLIVNNFSDCICILYENTLIRTYTIEQIKTLNNESQLGMALFIEYGYLIKSIKKIEVSQLRLVL